MNAARLIRAAIDWLGRALDTQGPAAWADHTDQEDA